ncbi:hypothetical protein SG34_028835 [Thalassomonas viridans]|uniref:Uncharacterized protein n=1 Tax=Thalassomonas viridans TaxID=137584 RepID=A0AAF0C9W1_9GAMM|nr:hypothetical protein [Thalassomonas viridans]WDE05249.1 hypothetical protein SG34_028835 [Thalassomonas viridans]
MLRIILITLLSLIASNLYAKTSNFDVMIPCHGCSEYKKELEALNAAFHVGQTIYVVDNRNGEFFIHEYYVNSIDPDNMSTSNANMRLMTKHIPGSAVSQDFARHDAILKGLSNKIIQPFTIDASAFPSAFIGTDASDFADWFSAYHYEKNKQDFDLLDAEMADAAATLTIAVNIKVFSMSYTFNSTNYLEYSFPDGTSVQLKFEVMKNAVTGKYHLQFKDPKFFDSKRKPIPKSKITLTDYINNGGNLEEKGDNDAIKQHINLVFEGNVQYIGFGEGLVREGSVEVLDCRIETIRGKQVVACYLQ